MRRMTEPVCLLRGQILLAEWQHGEVVLDCVLTRDPQTAGVPITLLVRYGTEPAPSRLSTRATLALRFPGRLLPPIEDLRRLKAWTDAALPVEVGVFVEDVHAQVRLRVPGEELVLEPDDGAYTWR